MNIDHFKQKLETEKMRLETEMASVGRKNPSVPNDWEPVSSTVGMEADLADQADVFMSRESNTAILADLEARYDAILAALDRIEKQTYGVCSVCGKDIEVARLEADPAAVTCVAHV